MLWIFKRPDLPAVKRVATGAGRASCPGQFESYPQPIMDAVRAAVGSASRSLVNYHFDGDDRRELAIGTVAVGPQRYYFSPRGVCGFLDACAGSVVLSPRLSVDPAERGAFFQAKPGWPTTDAGDDDAFVTLLDKAGFRDAVRRHIHSETAGFMTAAAREDFRFAWPFPE